MTPSWFLKVKSALTLLTELAQGGLPLQWIFSAKGNILSGFVPFNLSYFLHSVGKIYS